MWGQCGCEAECSEVDRKKVMGCEGGVREEWARGRRGDGDVGKRAKWVRAICRFRSLHLAETEKINGESRREVGRIHGISGGKAVQEAAMGDSAGATDTTN